MTPRSLLESFDREQARMSVLNRSVENVLFEDNPKDLRYGSAYPTLFFALVCIPILFHGSLKRKVLKGRSLKEIPRLLQFPVELPPLLDGLVAAFRARKYGIRVMDEWWKSLGYADLVRLEFPFRKPAICVFNPDLIRKVLGSADTRLLNKPKMVYHVMFPNLAMDGLLPSNVDVWQPHRKVLNRFFAYNSLNAHLKVLNKYGNALATTLNGIGDNVEEKRVSATIYDNLLQVILEVLMGPDNWTKDETADFVHHFRKLKPLLTYRLLNPINLFPPVWWLNPTKKIYDEAMRKTGAYVLKGIERTTKLEQSKSKNETGDVGEEEVHGSSCLSHMLKANFSRREIDAEIATLLFTGHETTYEAIGFILQHLAENPKMQQICHDEVDNIFGNKDKQEISMEDLSSLKYLERCIYESLRLSPAVPIVARELADSFEFEGYQLEKGTLMVFSSWLVHRNPDIYPEPEKFEPDRFLPEAVKARHPYAYLPFSAGPRNCIGWKLAVMEMKTFLAYLLRDYYVETTDKFSEMKLEFEISLVPHRNFNTSLKKREKR